MNAGRISLIDAPADPTFIDPLRPSQISDKIKDLLFAKAAEKVDDFRPAVANVMFNSETAEEE